MSLLCQVFFQTLQEFEDFVNKLEVVVKNLEKTHATDKIEKLVLFFRDYFKVEITKSLVNAVCIDYFLA